MVKRGGSTKLTNYTGNFLNPSLDTWSEAMHCGDSFPGSSSPITIQKATHRQNEYCAWTRTGSGLVVGWVGTLSPGGRFALAKLPLKCIFYVTRVNSFWQHYAPTLSPLLRHSLSMCRPLVLLVLLLLMMMPAEYGVSFWKD